MSAELIYNKDGPISDAQRETICGWFRQNFGDLTGERNYQRLVPKVIVEPWLKLNGEYCHDYRLFMYHGDLRLIEVKLRRSETEHDRVLFTPDWQRFPGKLIYGRVSYDCQRDDIDVSKPDCLDSMIVVSKNVARYLDFVRVDFFSDGHDAFYVGEITHVHGNVRQTFDPVETEALFTRSALD